MSAEETRWWSSYSAHHGGELRAPAPIPQVQAASLSFSRSCARMSGDEMMHHALKCERVSTKERPGSPEGPWGPSWQPLHTRTEGCEAVGCADVRTVRHCHPPARPAHTSSASGKAQQPGKDTLLLACWMTVCRLDIVDAYEALMSPLVR